MMSICSQIDLEEFHPLVILCISPSDAYMRQWIGTALAQIMACRLIGAKPLSKPMLDNYELNP